MPQACIFDNPFRPNIRGWVPSLRYDKHHCMTTKSKQTFSKRFGRQYSLGRYSFYMAMGALIFWSVLLGLGAFNNFRSGFANGQVVSVESASLIAAWIIFVAVFVSALSATLRSRRGVHLGLLVPTDTEKAHIERSHPVLATKTWSFVIISTFAVTLLGTGISFALFEISKGNIFTMVLTSVILPSLSAAFVSWWNSKHSVHSLLYSQHKNLFETTSVFSYSLFQNALPYTLFYTLLGIAIALWRFSAKQMNANQVSSELLWRHLSATSFFISLFLTSASKVKAKIDFLGPIKFHDASKTKPLKIRWRLWYALAIPPIVYFSGRVIFYLFSLDAISIVSAVTVKGVFCVICGLGLCLWAVRTNLGELITDGKDEHPYIRFRKFLHHTRIS